MPAVGIVAFGAYIPYNRLKRETIAAAFGDPAAPGEKAVANYDEDSVSMAVNAAIDCLRGLDPKLQIDAVYLASTTLPYREKLSAPVIAAALELPEQVRTADFASSLRCGSTAMLAAFDAVRGGARQVLVAAADCRLGAAQGQWEQLNGDGAAALLIGSENVIAELEGWTSVSNEIVAIWRSGDDRFIRSWEERFALGEGYVRAVGAAVMALAAKTGLTPADINRAVISAPHPRVHAVITKRIGFKPEQVQDTLWTATGLTGAASPLQMLVAALEKAEPGERILFVAYGDGCDAMLFRVTGAIKELPPRRGIKGHLTAKKNTMAYTTYLKWKNMLPVEPPRRPDPQRPSAPAMWRNRKQTLSFTGSRCRRCGTPQYPPQRVCVYCQAKDEMEPYRFAGREARIATYTVDYLTYSPDPPTVFAVVDFEGGGRYLCEMTDCDPKNLAIGQAVEMTFRRLYEAGGIHTYFWKARPRLD